MHPEEAGVQEQIVELDAVEAPEGPGLLRPRQGHRPGDGLDGHLPVAVTAARPRILGQRGAGIAVTAEKLGDLGLESGLHQQRAWVLPSLTWSS